MGPMDTEPRRMKTDNIMANKQSPRTLLNNALQSMYGGRATSESPWNHVKWEFQQTGSVYEPTWHASIYIDDMNYGTASAATKGAAQDQAARQAYDRLRIEGKVVGGRSSPLASLSFPNRGKNPSPPPSRGKRQEPATPTLSFDPRIPSGRADPLMQTPVSDAILTSGNKQIPKSTDDLASSHPHVISHIDLHPVQDLGPVVDGSDVSLHGLTKYMEGNSFDLRGIGELLSFPGLHPNLKCAALQLLEHAAIWQNTNFTECMSATFSPVANLVIDSREIQVHCAALDTLTLFLESPHATDVVKSMMPRGVVEAVSKDLNFSEEPHVQLASVELLVVAAQSEEILIEFATAASRIPSALPSMPNDTRVTALRVLEIGVRARIHEILNTLMDELHHLREPLSSPDAAVQIATLKVLEASAQGEDSDLFRAVETLSPCVKEILSSDKPDLHRAAGRVMELLKVGRYTSTASAATQGISPNQAAP